MKGFLLVSFLTIVSFASSGALRLSDGFVYGGQPIEEEVPVVEEEVAVDEYPDSVAFDNPVALFPDDLDEFYSYAAADTVLRLAVVLSDIYGKKEMEFTRGLLLGIERAGLPSNSLSLKIVNGEVPADSLLYELDLFGPHVVLTTQDKDCPRELVAYAKERQAKILNAFDTRSEDFLYNPGIFQLLSPSGNFNSASSAFFTDNFAGNTLLIVGEPDGTDQILRDMILAWPEDDLLLVSPEDFPSIQLDETANYLVYPVAGNSNEVKDILSQLIVLMSETPLAGIRVVGRPNWIAFTNLPSMIPNMEVYIPAKCYFDPTSPEGKRFISDFNAKFGHAPIRSYPVYAVMGYDTAVYFLPRLLEELKGDSLDLPAANLVQSYFDLSQAGWNAGFYNKGAVMLHFEPWGSLQKILISK